MQKINTIILDDNREALNLLKRELEKFPRIELLRTFTDPRKALTYMLQGTKVQLLILDKEMPGLDGLDIVPQLPPNICCVMITGYMEFALDAYNSDMADYILKPATFGRLAQMLRKVEVRFGLTQSVFKADAESSYFTIRSDNELHMVDYDELFFLKSGKDESILHLIDGGVITAKERIGTFEDELPRRDFKRVHNQYLVNKHYVRVYKDGLLEMRCGGKTQLISVGPTYKKDVDAWFNDRKIG